MGKLYSFDVGNTNAGPLGLSAVVYGKTKAEAVNRLQDLIDRALDADEGVQLYDTKHEYVRVYLNPEAIKARHAEVWETGVAGPEVTE